MSTSVAPTGIWGAVEDKLSAPTVPEEEGLGGIWGRLETLVDPGEYRPKIADDLEVKKFERRGGEPYYMVANPRDLVHYRLEAADYELLAYMDGTKTVKEIVVDRLREGGEIDVGGVADLVYTLYIENFLEDRYVDVDAMVKQAVDPKLRRHRLRRFASS